MQEPDRYYHDAETNRTLKLTSSGDKTLLYWVQCQGDGSGQFIHSRGCDVLQNRSKGLKVCEAIAQPSTEARYKQGLMDYFAADKAVREAFIKKYNL